MDRQEARRLIRDHVVPPIASRVGEEGFQFYRGALHFRRSDAHARQEVALAFDLNPRYAPGAGFALHPQIRIEYPELSDLLRPESVNVPGIALSQPLSFGAPAGAAKEWDIGGEIDAPSAGRDIASHLGGRAVPLLNDLRTPDALADAYARKDPRIAWHDTVVAAVVALHLLRGRPQAAGEIAAATWRGSALDSLFPKVGRLLRTNGSGGGS